MADTVVKMQDGRVFCGQIYYWRPQYGYLTLSGADVDTDYGRPLPFGLMESAVTRSERVGPQVYRDQDEMLRAVQEGWLPYEPTDGNFGMIMAGVEVQTLIGGKTTLHGFLCGTNCRHMGERHLLVRYKGVNDPFVRGEHVGFKGVLDIGYHHLIFERAHESGEHRFWVVDHVYGPSGRY